MRYLLVFTLLLVLEEGLFSQRCQKALQMTDRELRMDRPSLIELLRVKTAQTAFIYGSRIQFRHQEEGLVAEAYNQMTPEVFDTVNAPQIWVNRRQIPQSMNGRIPLKDAVVLDLGAGPGTSTQILARYADPSWLIIGYDISDHLIHLARERINQNFYVNRQGHPVQVAFVEQSVTDPLHMPDHTLVPSNSVDFVNSSGIVGHHLNPDQFSLLAKEIRRVMKPGGYAALDSGPHLLAEQITLSMEREGFRLVGKSKSFVIEPRPQLIFQKHEEL